jgi:hypothetical protein
VNGGGRRQRLAYGATRGRFIIFLSALVLDMLEKKNFFNSGALLFIALQFKS